MSADLSQSGSKYSFHLIWLNRAIVNSFGTKNGLHKTARQLWKDAYKTARERARLHSVDCDELVSFRGFGPLKNVYLNQETTIGRIRVNNLKTFLNHHILKIFGLTDNKPNRILDHEKVRQIDFNLRPPVKAKPPLLLGFDGTRTNGKRNYIVHQISIKESDSPSKMPPEIARAYNALVAPVPIPEETKVITNPTIRIPAKPEAPKVDNSKRFKVIVQRF